MRDAGFKEDLDHQLVCLMTQLALVDWDAEMVEYCVRALVNEAKNRRPLRCQS